MLISTTFSILIVIYHFLHTEAYIARYILRERQLPSPNILSQRTNIELLNSFQKQKPSMAQSFLQSIGFTAKYVVSGSVALIILRSKSNLPLYYTICALSSSIVGKILKKTIKQPRPTLSKEKGYGMPSSHTLAISFFSTIVSHFLPQFVRNKSLQLLSYLGLFVYGVSAW
jgi:membrane-associated phospholipid phosphatase